MSFLRKKGDFIFLHNHRALAKAGLWRRSPDTPGVDAADHVLGQQVGGSVARPGRLGQEKHHQAPHLEVVPAVVDEAPAEKNDSGPLTWTHVAGESGGSSPGGPMDPSRRIRASQGASTSVATPGSRGKALAFGRTGNGESVYVANICPSF